MAVLRILVTQSTESRVERRCAVQFLKLDSCNIFRTSRPSVNRFLTVHQKSLVGRLVLTVNHYVEVTVQIWNLLMLKLSAIGGSPKFRKIADSPIWAGSNDRKL